MASFVKSLDNKHLLEIGMEGFYGDSVPERKSINPGYQVGTDFISNHLIKEIDFATIHAYTDQWYIMLFFLHSSHTSLLSLVRILDLKFFYESCSTPSGFNWAKKTLKS